MPDALWTAFERLLELHPDDPERVRTLPVLLEALREREERVRCKADDGREQLGLAFPEDGARAPA